MSKNNILPECMTIIINIQMMQDATFGCHSDVSVFATMSYDSLFELQGSMIEDYNKVIKDKNAPTFN